VSVGVAPGAPAGAVASAVDVPCPKPGASGSGRVAALDGLRGIAVAVVVVFHLDRLQGGFLGVDLFFVLSGFLITSLLLGEVASRGNVGLGGFWSRRARRLIPALLLVLVGISVLLLALTPEPQRARFRGDAVATLGYVANWHSLGSHLSYWDMFSQPSPLQHMWSLAIEEQFYLFWPLVVLGLAAIARRRRGSADSAVDVTRLVGGVAVVGAAISLVWLAWSFKPRDTNFAYFSTPTRLGPTLLGAALAAWSSRRRTTALLTPADRPPSLTDPGGESTAAERTLSSAGVSVGGVEGRPSSAEAGGASWIEVEGPLSSAGVSVGGVEGPSSSAEAGGASWIEVEGPLSPAGLGTVSAGAALGSSSSAEASAGGVEATLSGGERSPERVSANGSKAAGGPPAWAWDVAGLVGLVVIAVLVVALNGTGPGYYRGGLVVFAAGSLAVIACIVVNPSGLVSRSLSVRPLCLLGIVSYGVYLWHWPINVFLTPDRAHLGGLPLDVVRVGVTMAAAAASYAVVERPIRRGVLREPALQLVGLGGLVVTMAAVLVATSGTPAADTIAVPTGRLAGVDTELLRVPADVPPGTTKVLLVGDSGPSHWAPQLVDEIEVEGRPVAVAFASDIRCSPVYAEGPSVLYSGQRVDREPCNDTRRDLWRRLIDEYDPDLVIQYFANVGLLERYKLDGRYVRDCDPSYDAYLRRMLDGDAEILTSRGATLALATSHYVATLLEGTRDQVDCRNRTYRAVAGDGPHRTMLDLNGFVLSIEREMDPFMDPVHLSDEAGQRASQWLLPQLDDLIRAGQQPPATTSTSSTSSSTVAAPAP